MYCSANDFSNFVRVDDEGNEVKVSVKDSADSPSINKHDYKPSKDDLMQMLDEMIKQIDSLPSQAMSLPITHYDFSSALILFSALFRAS